MEVVWRVELIFTAIMSVINHNFKSPYKIGRFKKNQTFESLKHLHHNINLITNLYKKEIDDYENFLIEEADDYNRFNKVGKKLHLTH